MSEDRLLPKPRPTGWRWIIGTFAVLGVIGVALSLIFRTYSDSNDPTVRERRANAELVSYAVVFSTVEPDRITSVIQDIVADIGADSNRTDLVIGSSATDPWSQSMAAYKSSLSDAMTNARELPIGKQTLITSMVAGLLIKSEMPARVYLIGTLNGEFTDAIRNRTQETVDALNLRASTRGPVTVISYLDTTEPIQAEYARFYSASGLSFEQR